MIDYYTLRKQRDWYEDIVSDFRRWKHWNFIRLRRFFINLRLHRMRCSECHKVISCYGYEGLYDMCEDCFSEAHPY